MEEIALAFSLVGLVAFLKKFVDLSKAVRNSAWNDVGTQLIVYAGAFVLLLVYGASGIAGRTEIIPGHTIASLNWADAVIAALGLGSIASLVNDRNKAVDPTIEPANYALFTHAEDEVDA